MESFHDELVGPGVTGLPERFFDRFVFNLHRTDATAPSIIFGLGTYRRATPSTGSRSSPPGPSSATSVSPPS